jgi:broad specificity phosphatase PhoE
MQPSHTPQAIAACAAAAVLLAFAVQRRRARRLADPRVTRIFLVRHAERHDHILPDWAASAARPHDSPLSAAGFEQAQRSGAHLRKRIASTGVLHVRSSPLVRAVQTAACITASLGLPMLPLQIDDALCEEEQFLRPRMMGTHRSSVPAAERMAVAPTCDAPRGVCQPVLLRAGDLLTVHRHIDVLYRGVVCPVAHDPVTGAELHALTLQPQTANERAQHIVDGLAHLVPPGSSTVLVTHGRFASRLAEHLLGKSNIPTDGSLTSFGYAEVLELVCETGHDCGPGMWRVVPAGSFAPAGAGGRGRNA